MSNSPVEPNKRASKTLDILVGLLMAVVGLVAMMFGVMQFRKHMSKLADEVQGSKYQVLLDGSDKSLEDGKKRIAAVAPQFQRLLDAIDQSGVEIVRKDQADLAKLVAGEFATAAASFRTAAQDLDDYRHQAGAGKLDVFLVDKAAAYRRLAEAMELNRRLAEMLLDKSIADTDTYLAKVEPLLAERDAAEKAATELSAKADEEGKPPPAKD